MTGDRSPLHDPALTGGYARRNPQPTYWRITLKDLFWTAIIAVIFAFLATYSHALYAGPCSLSQPPPKVNNTPRGGRDSRSNRPPTNNRPPALPQKPSSPIAVPQHAPNISSTPSTLSVSSSVSDVSNSSGKIPVLRLGAYAVGVGLIGSLAGAILLFLWAPVGDPSRYYGPLALFSGVLFMLESVRSMLAETSGSIVADAGWALLLGVMARLVQRELVRLNDFWAGASPFAIAAAGFLMSLGLAALGVELDYRCLIQLLWVGTLMAWVFLTTALS
jgi:hypothetical protein